MPKPRTNVTPLPDPLQVPADFRIIEASGTSDFRLEAADADSGEPRKLRRFSMTAYTGGKLLLANFPFPVIVDLSGMRIPAKSRPILRDHDIGRIVGHTESIEINGSSIRLAGVISASNDHAREVTYVRGNDQVTVLATIGRTRFETDDGTAVRVEFTDRDFLILASDLVLAGYPTEPQRGDLIREGTREFEVLDWRYSDPYRLTLRITTKAVD